MSSLASGFAKFHIIGNSTMALTKVANNATLQVDKASTHMTIVNADATSPADTSNASLGTSTFDSVNFGTLIFKDAASVGLGTVNLVSNGVDTMFPATHARGCGAFFCEAVCGKLEIYCPSKLRSTSPASG